MHSFIYQINKRSIVYRIGCSQFCFEQMQPFTGMWTHRSPHVYFLKHSGERRIKKEKQKHLSILMLYMKSISFYKHLQNSFFFVGSFVPIHFLLLSLPVCLCLFLLLLHATSTYPFQIDFAIF